MPIMRARAGNWFDVYEIMFWLWINPKSPRPPKTITTDISGHFLYAAHKEFGADEIKIGPKEISQIYAADPKGVRMPINLTMMTDGIVAGAILYSVLRLSMYDSARASVENAVRLVAYHRRKSHQPSSRAGLMRAWSQYKSVSHFFAAIIHDGKAFKALGKLMGLTISQRELMAAENVIPLTSKQLRPWMRDIKKLRANMEKIAKEVLPTFFATSERFRELGQIHYAPGQKKRNKPLLDPKIMWKIPRGFKFPPVKINLKRLTKAERIALST